MRRVVLVTLILLVVGGAVFADEIVSATPVAVQSNPYDLETLLNTSQTGVQTNESSGQPLLSASEVTTQGSWLDAYTVVQAKYVGKEEASMDVNLSITYDVEADKTNVTIDISSPVVPAFVNVLVFTPEGKLVKSYVQKSGTTNHFSFQLSGYYEALFVVVAGEGLAVAGTYDFTALLTRFIYGTNVIPFKVNETGTYNIYSVDVEGISPVIVTSKLQTFYVVAKDVGAASFYVGK